MERLWEAKDWEQLAELETQVWVDGWGQPATRVDPELRRQVHGWILDGYRAGKPKVSRSRSTRPRCDAWTRCGSRRSC